YWRWRAAPPRVGVRRASRMASRRVSGKSRASRSESRRSIRASPRSWAAGAARLRSLLLGLSEKGSSSVMRFAVAGACYNSAPERVKQAEVMPKAEADATAVAQLKDVVTFALDEAARQGATQAAADASINKGLGVTARLGEVETVEYQRDRGLGVTV